MTLFEDPKSLQALHDRLGVASMELEGGVEDDQIIDAAFAVRKLQRLGWS